MIQLVQEKLMDMLEIAMTQHRPFNHDGIDISRTPSRIIVSELAQNVNGIDYTGSMTVSFHWEEDHVLMKFCERYEGLSPAGDVAELRLSLKSILSFICIEPLQESKGLFQPNLTSSAIQIQRMIQVLKTLSAQTKPE